MLDLAAILYIVTPRIQKGINAVQQYTIENQKGVMQFNDVPLRARRALTLFSSIQN